MFDRFRTSTCFVLILVLAAAGCVALASGYRDGDYQYYEGRISSVSVSAFSDQARYKIRLEGETETLELNTGVPEAMRLLLMAFEEKWNVRFKVLPRQWEVDPRDPGRGIRTQYLVSSYEVAR